MDMKLSKLGERVEDRGALLLWSMGLQRVGHDLGTEQQQTREGRGCRAWEEQPRNSSESPWARLWFQVKGYTEYL